MPSFTRQAIFSSALTLTLSLSLSLSLSHTDIAEKEKCVVTPAEVKEQLDVLIVQAKQKGEEPPDVARATDEIENVLLRKKVFDMLASHATITWIDAPVAPAE